MKLATQWIVKNIVKEVLNDSQHTQGVLISVVESSRV
jgi:hypothetical protein